MFYVNAFGQLTMPGSLAIEADMPVVETGPRSPGRNFLILPSLDYNFELDVDCATGLLPKTVSLSIADTRKSLATADISSNEVTPATLSIPASQIAPVAVGDFCIGAEEDQEQAPAVGDPEPALDTLGIASVLSVHASLLCANDIDSQMIYASKSLGVTLLCVLPPSEQATTSN